jgi:hypothetical protein
LRDLDGVEAVARARADAWVYAALAADDIAHRRAQRARFPPEASALHLPRREDLLEVEIPQPDRRLSHVAPPPPTQQG